MYMSVNERVTGWMCGCVRMRCYVKCVRLIFAHVPSEYFNISRHPRPLMSHTTGTTRVGDGCRHSQELMHGYMYMSVIVRVKGWMWGCVRMRCLVKSHAMSGRRENSLADCSTWVNAPPPSKSGS